MVPVFFVTQLCLWGIEDNGTVASVYGVRAVGTQLGLVEVISVGLGIVII